MQIIRPDDLDPGEVLASLGYREACEPVPVPGGWDTLLWRFQTPDGNTHSLRIHFLPERDEAARRERLALEACARSGLPAPRVEATGVYQGMPVAILSWCPGRPLLSFIEKQPWRLWRLAWAFGRLQAMVHRIPPPQDLRCHAPLDWLFRVPSEYIGLAERVAFLKPATDTLIHMDYHPLNVIHDGNFVTGIVDWGGAAAGDRRADLARTCVMLETAPPPPGPLAPVLGALRRIMKKAWRAGYEETAGPMPDHRPFRAWAGATLLGEIERVIDYPGVWGTHDDIATLRQYVTRWSSATIGAKCAGRELRAGHF